MKSLKLIPVLLIASGLAMNTFAADTGNTKSNENTKATTTTTNNNTQDEKANDTTTSDSMITAKVKAAYVKEKLFGDRDISVMGITVETKDGVVTLTGNVDNKEQATNAEKIAKTIEGVKKVESKLTVKTNS